MSSERGAAGLMTGKRGLIMGLANDRSLAWGIARALGNQGAELAFSYQGEALEKRVRPLAAEVGSDFLIDCDVSDEAALDAAFKALAERWPTIDFVVHAIGYSDKNELRGLFVDTSAANFAMTMNISAYSFVGVTRRARAMMPDGGSVLTLTYYGAEKVIPHYNVMGVAKAALENTSRYVARDLFLDGNTFRSNTPSVSKRPFVGEARIGAAVFWRNTRIAYTQVVRSEEFYGQKGTQTLGSLSASFRF